MEEKDPEVVEAAYILCSFTNKAAVPSSPSEPANLPSAGQKKKRSRPADERRSRAGWIAAAEVARIVAEKTAEVLAANSRSRSSPDSPLDFWRTCHQQTPPTAAADAAAEEDATSEEKQKRPEEVRRSQSEEKQKPQKGIKSLETSAPACACTASSTAVADDQEKLQLQESPRIAPPPSSSSSSSSSSSLRSKGDVFLLDLNLPPPDDC